MSDYCAIAPGHPLHGPYHDSEYGFPVADDDLLFERLCLEIFQAGLSWELILKRRTGLNAAFDGFVLPRVAAYGPEQVERLVADPQVIRHRRKIEAVIENARRLKCLRAEHGSFAAWLASHHPLTLKGWLTLFRRTFVFTGPEVVKSFLMSIGYLPGSHASGCPVETRLRSLDVPWRQAEGQGFRYSD